MFCCSWTTYLEQLTCQSARQGSQLHRIQKTTENIRVSDRLWGIMTFFIMAPYNILLLTYLFTYLLTSDFWHLINGHIIAVIYTIIRNWINHLMAYVVTVMSSTQSYFVTLLLGGL